MQDALKAMVFAGAALVLLLPTFNALNGSHLDAVEPPFKIKPPNPPQNVPPPEDGDDFQVPEGEDEFPLPEDCPPPEDRVVYRATFGQSSTAQGDDATLEVPPRSMALGIRVTYQSFKGNLEVALEDPAGDEEFDETNSVFQPQPSRTETVEEVFEAPMAGNWNLNWDSSFVVLGGGSIHVVLRLPCGGELHE